MPAKKNKRSPAKKAAKRSAAPSKRGGGSGNKRRRTRQTKVRRFVWLKAALAGAGRLAGAAWEFSGTVLFKNAFALLVIAPLCWFTAETLYSQMAGAAASGTGIMSQAWFYFGLGAALWAALWFPFHESIGFLGAYVFGHEATHAAFSILSFGKVKGFHARASGGYVLTNRTNIFVALSPYFVPFYSLLAIGIYWTAEFAAKMSAGEDGGGLITVESLAGWPAAALCFALGFTWVFHITYTIWMLARDQPDFEIHGHFFSVLLVIFVNLAIIAAMLIAAAPALTWPGFAAEWWGNATALPHWLIGIGR